MPFAAPCRSRNFPRPFRLRHGDLVAALAFIVANLVVFWAGASVTNHLFGGLLVAFLLYVGWQLARHGTLEHLHWRGALWLAPYFFGLWLITFLGPLHGTHTLGPVSGPVVIALVQPSGPAPRLRLRPGRSGRSQGPIRADRTAEGREGYFL